MKQHFVEFMSPGTMFSEVTTKEIGAWNVEQAQEMAKDIEERHSALPYGFRFITRERGDEDLDSHVSVRSHMYYLGGTVLTLKEVIARKDPDDKILINNMKINGYEKVIVNDNSWLITLPLEKEDVVL